MYVHVNILQVCKSSYQNI